MEIDKLLDFLRHLIVILLIVYLTRKVFVLEDKVEKLCNEIKNSDIFEEEYSTDNEIQTLNHVSAKSTEPIMINMPTKLDTSYYCSQHISNQLPSICKINNSIPSVVSKSQVIYNSPKSKSSSIKSKSPIIEYSLLNEEKLESNVEVNNIIEADANLEIEVEPKIEPLPRTGRRSLKDLQNIAVLKNIDIKKENGKFKTIKELKEEINI
jgi:hypothetical protein